MSFCKHLPEGRTLLKWRIEEFDEKLRTAVYGDQWSSGLFTTNWEENPSCFLVFSPPAASVNRSELEKGPSLECWHREHNVLLDFVEFWPADIDATFWIEDVEGNVRVPKVEDFGRRFFHSGSWQHKWARLDTDALEQLRAEKVVFVCCEIHHIGCCKTEHSGGGRSGEIRAVDRAAAPLEFHWQCGYASGREVHETPILAASGPNELLRFEFFSDLSGVWVSSPGKRSFEPFHYELWVENERGGRTYRQEGIMQVFANLEGLFEGFFGGAAEEAAFFTNGYALLRLRLRRLGPPFPSPLDPADEVDVLGPLREFAVAHFNDPNVNDIRVIAKGGVVFHVSKLVLCAHSEVFERMFAHPNMTERSEQKIEMDDVEPAIVERMLRFLHTGRVEGLREVDAALFVLADRYRLVQLQELCLASMCATFSVDTILDLLPVAFAFDSLPAFKQRALEYAGRNLAALTRTEEWKRFMNEHADIVNELICSKESSIM